jgi:hypothetical protein
MPGGWLMPGGRGWSGPGKGRGSIGFGGAGSMRHQNIGHQMSKKRPSVAHSGGGSRRGKGSMGSRRGYKAFKNPSNDGNLYTTRSKVKRTDFWGSHKGAARPSSWCFITSACVEAQGLAGDCEELALIRSLRDDYVRAIPEGPELVAEYYKKAPGIVRAIEALPEKERLATYSWIWREGIEPAVALIREGECAEALSVYRALCAELEDRLVPETLADGRTHPFPSPTGGVEASPAALRSTTTEGGPTAR